MCIEKKTLNKIYRFIYSSKILDNQRIILSKENPILNKKSNSTDLIGRSVPNW